MDSDRAKRKGLSTLVASGKDLKRLKESEEEVTRLELIVAGLRNELEISRTEENRLRGFETERGRLRVSLDHLLAQIRQMGQAIQTSAANLSSVQDQARSYEEQLQRAQAELNQLRPLSDEVEQLRPRIGQLQDNIRQKNQQLQQTILKLGSAQRQVQSFAQKFRYVQAELVESRAKLEPLHADHNIKVMTDCLNPMNDLNDTSLYALAQNWQRGQSISPEILHKSFSPAERYSCVNWIDHLVISQIPLTDNGEVYKFLDRMWIRWFKAMCLIGKADLAEYSMSKLQDVILVSSTS
jgi:predicted  nucleic acid-binding Zn-ribbon protein